MGMLTSIVELPNGRFAGLGYIRQRGKGALGEDPEGQEVQVGGTPATIVHIPAAQYGLAPAQLPRKQVEPTQQLGPADSRCVLLLWYN